ncbi:MAG TPA: hypothetical protein PLC25_04365 [Bacilli bacterium]|nr:hypothetical protein [Bacilli bacterium]
MFKASMRIASILKMIILGIVLTSIFKLSDINANYYFSLYSGMLVSIILLYIIAVISGVYVYKEKMNTMDDDDLFVLFLDTAKKTEIKHRGVYVITAWAFLLQLFLLLIYYLFHMHQHAYFFMRLVSILYVVYICGNTISRNTIKKEKINNE